MKNALILILLFISTFMHSQASWTFDIWFQLTDTEQKIITPQDFKEKEIKVFTAENGGLTETQFTYDKKVNCYKFHQHAIGSPTELYIVNGTDTLELRLSTSNMYVGTLPLVAKSYEFQLDHHLKNYTYFQWPAYKNWNIYTFTSSLHFYETKRFSKVPLLPVELSDAE